LQDNPKINRLIPKLSEFYAARNPGELEIIDNSYSILAATKAFLNEIK